MLPIFVVNNFGQFNHLILRMLLDLNIDAKMVPNTMPPKEVCLPVPRARARRRT